MPNIQEPRKADGALVNRERSLNTVLTKRITTIGVAEHIGR